ncbi:hypothetical protein JR316_0011832 [Psilocybe cubensis]|uniref:Uncharacterized protein n=1 Tax=Psilocybe cubensis TaxID=181762 RepID=A0ACB8GM28_PSICU|nr:hypothetical protein JR316_0011832 [Psilocybe cubensis]KAH9476261.1 hypothetical protein JR316_0011832 [Psilocybe cubensis]
MDLHLLISDDDDDANANRDAELKRGQILMKWTRAPVPARGCIGANGERSAKAFNSKFAAAETPVNESGGGNAKSQSVTAHPAVQAVTCRIGAAAGQLVASV